MAAIYQCRELNNREVIQACSTREQGNLALHTGDSPAQVLERRARFLDLFGFELEELVIGNQTHGTRVGVVTREMAGSGAWDQKTAIPDTDALITQERGIVLGIFTADCLPIFIYDQATPSVGIIHAGWRGTINRIVQITLEEMTAQFHTDPAHCLIGFGPGIGSECFQVEPKVAKQFFDVVPEAVNFAFEGIPGEAPVGGSGYRVDLEKFNTRLLQAAGVLERQIIPLQRCTRCHVDEFYSYRAEGGSAGRMMSIIALQKGAHASARSF
ncbi:MAG TPA: peptidoglycan editing factor PgeF [Bacillota bacterium]|nr:peptidoglycan editing factor PgeF [Bacillota bacterium]